MPLLIAVMECLATLSALSTAPFAQGETLDRIAVTVGRHVISEHDILQDIRLSTFIDGKQPDFSALQKRNAAARLIDQYLVLEDAVLTRTPMPSAADVAPILSPIRARYASDQGYRSALAQAHISDADLSAQLLAGLRMLRYTDLRFRPQVEVSEDALHAYHDKLAAPQSFEASRNDIEKLLTDQQTMQALDRWLAMARGEKPIVYHEDVFQ
ncbi:MAG: hypothetical protein ABI833_05485 [Acidobacteriota bacterium]